MATPDTKAYRIFTDPQLLGAGLNLHAVLRIQDLPESVTDNLRRNGIDSDRFQSLLLVGNGGSAFWRAYREFAATSADPVDEFSLHIVKEFLARQWPGRGYHVVYPGGSAIALQTLGRVAGWHHDSPLKVGINDTWGLWYAYRALVALEGVVPASTAVASVNPCESCSDKPCVVACPPNALAGAELNLDTCLEYRTEAGAECSNQCRARLACPVADQHRYDLEQVHYHYGRSLRHIVAWRQQPRSG